MNPIKRGGGRLVYLDSARGLAAFSVMITHFVFSFQLTTPPLSRITYPLHFFWYGEADILFFFIHSGFILSYSISRRLNKTKASSYIRFLIERVFRIYPLFIFIVLVSYLLKKHFFPISESLYTTEHLQSFWRRNMDIKSLLNELSLIYSVDQEGNKRLIPQEWTAAVEILIGCLVPMLLFFLKKVRLSWIYWLFILLIIKLFKFNSFLFDFALGVSLFYHLEQIKRIWVRLAISIKWLLIAIAILFFTCFFQFATLFNFEKVFIHPGIDHVIVSLGCGLFFCIILGSTAVQKILSHSFMITMGRICYSLYLAHMMILICFADYFVQLFRKIPGLSEGYCILLFFFVYAGLTLLISLFSYWAIENPFNQLGKRIAKKAEDLVMSFENRVFKRPYSKTNNNT